MPRPNTPRATRLCWRRRWPASPGSTGVYGPAPGGDRFLLLHRRRVWNDGEGRWIGWERKRGKLHELNRLLRGATDTTFLSLDGQPPAVPADVRYVITLDADTRLPRDTVRRLIGKMAHPLNRPRFDAAAGGSWKAMPCCSRGSRPSLPVGREGSLFQRIFSSMSGIDPYAAAVSDVYQDLFGEGSYAGKGIYDVDAFEAALAGRVPDSTLLSHDLFEGVFARAGSRLRYRGRRGVPRPLRRRRAAPPPLGARRLAAPAVDPRTWAVARCGSAARRHAGDRSLEDARQSAANAVGARGRPRPAGRMDAAVRSRARLDRLRSRDDRAADLHPRHRRHRAAPCRDHACAATSVRLAPICGSPSPSRLSGHVSCASGVADGRRDRADPGPAVRHAPASARMGSGGAGDDRSTARPCRASIAAWPARSSSAFWR